MEEHRSLIGRQRSCDMPLVVRRPVIIAKRGKRLLSIQHDTAHSVASNKILTMTVDGQSPYGD